MSWVIVGLTATTMLVLGLVLSFVLGWANRAFHVEVDPRVDAVIDALPGANCGGCGYVGCGEYAEAVVLDDEAVNPCTVGGTKLCGSTGSGHGGGGRRQLSLATGGPKEVKSVCKVGCLGCRACERTSGMFTVVNNLSTINYDNYTLKNLTSGLVAAKKCPRNRLVFEGIPSDKDILAVAGEELPDVIEPDFKTSVDDTEWRG